MPDCLDLCEHFARGLRVLMMGVKLFIQSQALPMANTYCRSSHLYEGEYTFMINETSSATAEI